MNAGSLQTHFLFFVWKGDMVVTASNASTYMAAGFLRQNFASLSKWAISTGHSELLGVTSSRNEHN